MLLALEGSPHPFINFGRVFAVLPTLLFLSKLNSLANHILLPAIDFRLYHEADGKRVATHQEET